MSVPFDPEPPAAFAAYWANLVATAHGAPGGSSGGSSGGAPPTPPAAYREAQALYGPIAGSGAEPFTIGQMGQSLDGFIATHTGASHYVTGPESRVHLHRLRALCDAVVVGWRTVDADDPRLTVRDVPGPDPVRAVIDLAGRLPPDARVFQGGRTTPLRLVAADSPPTPLPGVEDVPVPSPGGRAAPQDVVAALNARGLPRLLIEGGGRIVTAFLEAGALDRLHVAVAPLVIGGGRPGLDRTPAATLDEALRPPARTIPMGADVLFDLDLAAAGGAQRREAAP